jgi:uncharacterized protein YoxC
MIIAELARVGAWMQRAAATLPDTIVTRQIVERGWFDETTHIAAGILTLILLAVVVMLLPAAWYIRRRSRNLAVLLDGLHGEIAPLIKSTNGLVENMNHIATTIRQDVDRISETVRSVDAQVREAAKVAGERVQRFDDLLEAVQEEAEDIFTTTATVVRGARAGARALQRRRRRKAAEEAEEDAAADGAEEAPPARKPRIGPGGESTT